MSKSTSVLVVEDDLLQALDLELALQDAGLSVIGPVGDADRAIELVTNARIDFAILDYNLGSSTSAKVAERLRDMDIPFFYLTGRPESVLSDNAPKAHIIRKPYNQSEVLEHVRHAVH